MIPLPHPPICPIVISKRYENEWKLCNDLAEYLVQGTFLCTQHAMYSDVQKSFLSVCGREGEDHHVIRPGQRRCLCDKMVKA